MEWPLISHIVLIRLKDTLTDDQVTAFMDEARSVLGAIAEVRNLRVGRGLGVKAEVDHPVALVMDFEDEAALERYQVHPEHRRFVESIVGPIQDDKRVYDYRY